jgi:antitoxin ParD1/3/4
VPMARVSVSLPDEMKEWLDERVKNSRYATAGHYVRDLIRRDHDERAALIQALIEGEQSGTSPRNVRQIIAAAKSKLLHDRVELSQAADHDLNDIHIYSYREFGEAKADEYLFALERCFEQLAVFPGLGRPIDHIRPGYLRPLMAATQYSRGNPGGPRAASAHGPERHL